MRIPALVRILITCTVLTCAAFEAFAGPPVWPTQPSQPLEVSTLGPQAYRAVAVSDGAGGAYVVWEQQVAGEYDIRAQYFRADGTRAPGWPAAGVAVCGASGGQGSPVATADGSGGLLVAWRDLRSLAANFDVYVQRITAAGTPAAGWAVNGVKLAGLVGDEQNLSIVADGTGGAFVTWERIVTPPNERDVYAGRVNASGTVVFSSPVSAVAGRQTDARAETDGAGGIIVVWADETADRIAAQRLTASGALLWANSGITVSNATAVFAPRIATDGAGGAYVAWTQYVDMTTRSQGIQRLDGSGAIRWSSAAQIDGIAYVSTGDGIVAFHEIGPDGVGGIYSAFFAGVSGFPLRVVRHTPGGGLASGWTANGLELQRDAFINLAWPTPNFTPPQPDGAGGAYVAAVHWDGSGSGVEVRLHRVTGAGGFAANWYGGVLLGDASVRPGDPALAVLPGGHAFVAWESELGAVTSVVHVARADRFGWLGDPSPAIASVRDVAHDQGGQVRVSWTASTLDAEPSLAVTSYRVWKQVPVAATSKQRPEAGGLAAPGDAGLALGARIALPAATGVTYWELAGTQPAQALPAYSMTVATAGDSMAGANPRTTFMVTAVHQYSTQFWNSAPDSGYSVDNVAPPTPAPFTGTYATGSTALHWTASPAPDFVSFRLYRGASPDFVPGGATFVAETTDTGWVDASPLPRVYKLVAVDVHGNVSVPAVVTPGVVTGVEAEPLALVLAAPAPNPARGATTLRWTLASAGPVRLTLHDVSGRRIRTLEAGERSAGEHVTTIALADDAGRALPPGLYLVRMEAAGRERVRRVAAMR